MLHVGRFIIAEIIQAEIIQAEIIQAEIIRRKFLVSDVSIDIKHIYEQ